MRFYGGVKAMDTNSIAAAFTQALGNPAYLGAFDSGLLLGAGVVAGCFCFSFLRAIFDETEDI